MCHLAGRIDVGRHFIMTGGLPGQCEINININTNNNINNNYPSRIMCAVRGFTDGCAAVPHRRKGWLAHRTLPARFLVRRSTPLYFC